MTTATTDVPFGQLKAGQPTQSEQEQLDQFGNWFSRSRKTLHFVASRIVGGSMMIERAVENCWIKASRNPPSFESEGPFRSWIVRILISEALSILHQSNTEPYENIPQISQEVRPRPETRRTRS